MGQDGVQRAVLPTVQVGQQPPCGVSVRGDGDGDGGGQGRAGGRDLV
jgi:hypothetical protein